jgi:uncharacterized protein YndB with AHSA1/START domain
MYSKQLLRPKGSRAGTHHNTAHLKGNVAKGKEVTFRFTGRDTFRWKFAELSPTSGVRWECVEGPGTTTGTSVTFRLFDSDDGRTAVECDHEDWPDSDHAFATCNTVWGILMGRLRDYTETDATVPAFR